MAKGEDSFPDTAGLLAILLGTMNGRIDELFDLSTVPRKMMEIEKKYRLTTDEDNIDVAISKFFSRFGKFLEEDEITIKKLITFVGVDQYFIVNKNEDEFIFRYRVGANRPPQLTVKFQIKKGSNLIRSEINLDIKYEEPENVRAFMAVICALSDYHQLFSVQQSGNIWIIEEPNGNLIEVVAYRVKEISSSAKTECFVEIEPLNSKNIEHVVETIEKYEKALQLTNLVCEESIAEMFRS